jgi:hypothetical protein
MSYQLSKLSSSMKRKTVTFEPSPDVRRMMERALVAVTGNRPWGMRSHIINNALREWLTARGHARKKETPI